jgi:hypothetical protein
MGFSFDLLKHMGDEKIPPLRYVGRWSGMGTDLAKDMRYD